MKFSINRSLTSYIKVQKIISFLIRNKPIHIRKTNRNKLYLNVGCGGNIFKEFINLDYRWQPGVDICWDITKGIPLKSKSIEGIFTEHVLEHFPLEIVSFILREFHRLLIPNGNLRTVVPDGQLYLTKYVESAKTDFTLIQPPLTANDSFASVYSPIMSVNRIFRGDGHMFIFDYDMFYKFLEKHGFVDIKKERFMSGRNPKLLIDYKKRAGESLYIEATRPACTA